MHEVKEKHDRQSTNDATLRYVRATNVLVEKAVLHILSVYL